MENKKSMFDTYHELSKRICDCENIYFNTMMIILMTYKIYSFVNGPQRRGT